MTTATGFPPPGSTRPWNGRAVANARTWYATTHGITTCARCGQPLTPTSWRLGHTLDRQAYPELTWDTTNWQAECARCSNSSGARQGNARRPPHRRHPGHAIDKEDRTCKGCGITFRNRWINQTYCTPDCRQRHTQPAPIPTWLITWTCRVCGTPCQRTVQQRKEPSTRTAQTCPAHDSRMVSTLATRDKYRAEVIGDRPKQANGRPEKYSDMTLRPSDARVAMVSLSATAIDRPAAAELIPTPGDGPRFISPPSPLAVRSLYDDLVLWWATEGIEMRPWQEIVARRALEVDSGGNLVWRTVVVSTPRQSGKSWLIKALALARASHPDLFGGEVQKVVHVANRHLSARRIHSQAWGWAGRRDLDVRTAQGMERIIWPDESSWDALTLSNVYGESASLVMLDEVWDVSPEDYREGLRPTQVARRMPQLWALSTAHRRATGLMLDLLEQGRAGAGRVLVADWGARAGADWSDPAVWRASSPWWDPQREDEMRLMAGTPGFGEQWLNVWPERADSDGWLPGWFRLRAQVVPAWSAVAVEAAAGSSRPVVGFAGRSGDGVVVSAVRAESMAHAAVLARSVGVAPLVGKALMVDPVWVDMGALPRSATPVQALAEFRRLADDGVLFHDGCDVLAEQVAAVRMESGPGGGLRLLSADPVDAVKAALWAAVDARVNDWFAG